MGGLVAGEARGERAKTEICGIPPPRFFLQTLDTKDLQIV